MADSVISDDDNFDNFMPIQCKQISYTQISKTFNKRKAFAHQYGLFSSKQRKAHAGKFGDSKNEEKIVRHTIDGEGGMRLLDNREKSTTRLEREEDAEKGRGHALPQQQIARL